MIRREKFQKTTKFNPSDNKNATFFMLIRSIVENDQPR